VSPLAKLRALHKLRLPWVYLAVLAPLLWWLLGPSLVRRELVAHVSGLNGTSAWSLKWLQKGQRSPHGVWIDFTDVGDGILDIEPSGKAATPGSSFEFWLYAVKSDAGLAPDLKALLSGSAASDGWIPFQQGPGVIYVANKPGHLRLTLPGRVANLAYATTDRGGDVTLRYRGQTLTISTFSAVTAGLTLNLPTELVVPEAADLHQVLPVYSLNDVKFSWKALEGSTLSMTSARLRVLLLGHSLFERSLETIAGPGAAMNAEGRWEVSGPDPSLHWQSGLGLGFFVHLLGCLATLTSLCGLWALARWLAPRLPRIGRSPVTAIAVVAGLVLLVNLGLAWKAPLFVTPDGLDYIDSADGLVSTGTFARFPDYKAPGLSVVLAGAMLIWHDFLDGFGWINAGLGVASAAMAYALVRARAGQRWALAAALVVGCHPTMLTYECYLLREAPSATLVLAVALVLVKLADRERYRGRAAWLLTLLLAVLCAAGAYLRENLQLLLLFVPLILLITPWHIPLRTRSLRAGTVLLIAVALLLPRAIPLWREYHSFGVVGPKTQGNRALAAWSNALSDGNDTAFFSQEQWDSLSKAESSTRISDYEFTTRLFTGIGAPVRPAGIGTPAQRRFDSERLSKMYVDEAIAREPLRAAGDCAVAFANQLGLWNVQTNVAAASNEWYSRPLRGEPIEFSTNFVFDTSEYLWPERLRSERDRLAPLITRSRRGTEDLTGSAWLRFMNEWFWAFNATRPILAILFLVGAGLAVRRRDYALAGGAAIAFLSILGAALVVATPSDRFGVPFIPVIVCIAIYALATWRERPAGTPASR
jgi:hypothetical protein